MEKYDKLLRMYFFDRLQSEELDLIKRYFYDEVEGRYNEVIKDYIFEKKFENLINKGIVRPYSRNNDKGNKAKSRFLLDREVKNKLNKHYLKY